MDQSRLFKPLKIGNIEVKHRIGMAPLTRLRATADGVPTPLMKEHYSQRASEPGTLIISEGTFVSFSSAGGFAYTPGLWSDEQVAGWRAITDEVHRKGSFIFCQIFAMGRTAMAEMAEKDGVDIVGPSAIALEGRPVPRAMTVEEIRQSVGEFAAAARNAIRAGFDGVEIHGANGFLIDQFIQDVSNKREDEYGGSVENRSRFVHEVLKAVVEAIGAERVGLRLSPWSQYQGMGMENPIPQFEDVIAKAGALDLAYLHLIESRTSGGEDCDHTERLDFAYRVWNGPFLIAGGYDMADAQRLVDEEYPDKNIMVMFGRYFIANPDLVYRAKEGLQLGKWDRSSFYIPGSGVGYVDYPFSKEYLAKKAAAA
ncbi:hypothetical protein VUR80DRAFT_3981 [Thermomyces stellatus]